MLEQKWVEYNLLQHVVFIGEPCWSRTSDPQIKSLVVYNKTTHETNNYNMIQPVAYGGKWGKIGGNRLVKLCSVTP
ncbi:MAG: hypothetical protein H7833_21185, partial [Magnetococcus sp. DMHC-1]